MLLSNKWELYKDALRSLPADRAWTREDLLIESLLVERRGDAAMYYAPHNEWLRESAAVAVVGITPGFAQMRTACETARRGQLEGWPLERIGREAKEAAGMSGPLRANLVEMLDALRLQRHLRIDSCAGLFAEHRALLHTTSLLRYPAFAAGRNYTGSRPPLASDPWLLPLAHASIREELRLLRPALIVPLGRAVEEALGRLEPGAMPAGSRILRGFPHPSGANGHRRRQFAANAESMRAIAAEAFADRR